MFSSNDKISIRQVQILLILDLFSNASISMPKRVTDLAQQDGWMLIIGGMVLALIYGYVISSLCKMFPDKTIVEFSSEIVSKPIGLLIVIAFFIKLLVIASLELRTFGELVKQTLLNDTPIEVIMLILLVVVTYLTRKGYECRARIGEIILFIAFVPICLILLLGLSDVKFSNLAPIFEASSKDIFVGSFWISLLFGGVELMLLVSPYLNEPKKIRKATLQSIGFVAIIHLVVTIITIGIFGPKETSRQLWPVMTIMQVIEIPGSFIERQDALMMSFWIMTVFALISAYVFFLSILLSRIIKTKSNLFYTHC